MTTATDTGADDASNAAKLVGAAIGRDLGIAGPVLIATLVVGLVVGIIQAATSVNEQTLSFIPKLAITALVFVVLGAAMMGLLADFTREIMAQVAQISA